MKYVIWIFFLASIGSILVGYFLNTTYTEQFIGLGVVGIFIIVFPLFIYYRWKDRSLKDYMLTQENLDKMRDFKKNE